MTLQEMVREKNMTRYQLSQRSGIPWATLSDIWTGKTRLERCSGGTLVKLSGTLGITVEELIALDVETSMPPDDSKAEKPYFEVNLPQDLEKALREYIQGEQGLPLGRIVWFDQRKPVGRRNIERTGGLPQSKVSV